MTRKHDDNGMPGWLKAMGLPIGMIASFVGVGSVEGCLVSEFNDGYCANGNGDLSCEQQHGADGRVFCVRGTSVCLPAEHKEDPDFDGCVEQRPDDACYSPCGGGQSYPEEDACLGATGSTTGGGTTGIVAESTSSATDGPGDTTASSATGDPSTCNSHQDCADTAGTPVCNVSTGECVGCNVLDDGNAACAIASGMASPYCVGSGECVECTRHEHCWPGGVVVDGACDIFEGNCFSSDATVIDVDSSGSDLADVLAANHADEIIVRVGPLGNNLVPLVLSGPMVLSGAQTVAFIGISSRTIRPEIVTEEDAALMRVLNGATVYVYNLRFQSTDSGNSRAAECASGKFDARRSFFTSEGNATIVLSECEAMLENVFIRGRKNGVPAVSVYSSSNATFSYATIVGRHRDASDSSSLVECPGWSESRVSIRNSLVLTFDEGTGSILDQGGCASYDVRHSILENGPLLDPSNRALEFPANADSVSYEDWFMEGYPGNMHLNQDEIEDDLAPEGFAYLEIAVTQPGDDTVDIDGDSRRDSNVVGADVP